MYRNLTEGSISKSLILFALPMIAGNLLQQMYNIADTLIVGRFLGKNALAAVGSAYTLMTFLTSIFLGLAMGAGAAFSIYFGKNDGSSLKKAVCHAFVLMFGATLGINVAVFIFVDPILSFLAVPSEIYAQMREYLVIVFFGLVATSLYNFFACLLRAVGNSQTPLIFLCLSAVLNIALDLWFVTGVGLGIAGAAAATVIAQYVSGVGLAIYTLIRCRELVPKKRDMKFDRQIMREILNLSSLTCVQQSAMNFGILLIQRLVDSFGGVIMAAFAAAVKIDTFAYLPVQDFGNAFSTFAAQNYGADKPERLKRGFRQATALSAAFSLVISVAVFVFAKQLMGVFISQNETAVIDAGVGYLRIEGAFYIGIGCLFLLYGFYRAIKHPEMSVILTVISLGLRVALAYILSPIIGVVGIWISIPIGWFVADLAGYGYYFIKKKRLIYRPLAK